MWFQLHKIIHCFPNGVYQCTPYQQCVTVPNDSHLCQHLVLSVFFISTHLEGINGISLWSLFVYPKTSTNPGFFSYLSHQMPFLPSGALAWVSVVGKLKGPREPVIGTSVYLKVKLYVHVLSKSAGVVIPERLGISKSLEIQNGREGRDWTKLSLTVI